MTGSNCCLPACGSEASWKLTRRQHSVGAAWGVACPAQQPCQLPTRLPQLPTQPQCANGKPAALTSSAIARVVA